MSRLSILLELVNELVVCGEGLLNLVEEVDHVALLLGQDLRGPLQLLGHHPQLLGKLILVVPVMYSNRD